MTDTVTGGPDLPQERRIVTAIPGPKSQELHKRKARYVSDGIGVGLPWRPA
jgi:4-aminobutyrate aminotransferase/(S)-3-amino-2-methylpropionate transaminase